VIRHLWHTDVELLVDGLHISAGTLLEEADLEEQLLCPPDVVAFSVEGRVVRLLEATVTDVGPVGVRVPS
jgi:hypothetical protein